MAEAVKKTITTTKTVEVESEEVVLTLSRQEAESLAEVFYFIGGSPYKSRRGHVQAVAVALRGAGVRNPADDRWGTPPGRTCSGGLNFQDTDDLDVLEGLPRDPYAGRLR